MSARAWVARKDGQWSAEAKAARAAAKATRRAMRRLICSTCYGSFDSPACSLNPEGWSGHTVYGGVGRPLTNE